MKNFWNWVRNEDGTRTLYLEGVIAEESWFDDDITPEAFKQELLSGTGPITPGQLARRRLCGRQPHLYHAHGLPI